MMKIIVIIPAYNEGMNIEYVVDELIMHYPQYDYVIVNDGSKDDTADICYRKGYNLIDLPANLGLIGAVQTGIRYALKMDYDAVIQFDGDGQHRPEYIGMMEKEMREKGADVVIGSRFLHKKKDCTLRMFGSKLLSAVIYLSTGKKITDPTSGMRMFRKEILQEFLEDMNYGPEPDTISYLLCRGVKICEIPVIMNERVAGESYLSVTRSMKYMVLTIFSILFIQNFRKKKQSVF